MDRYESIETLAVKLNQPKLYAMSSKGLITEDIAQMKYNEAEAYGFTMDEYAKLKTYLQSHKMKTGPPIIKTSTVSPEPVDGEINQISNENTVRRAIFIGCTISSCVMGVLLLPLGYIVNLYSITPILSFYIIGGLSLVVGVILLAVGAYLVWSGKFFNQNTRVQVAFV